MAINARHRVGCRCKCCRATIRAFDYCGNVGRSDTTLVIIDADGREYPWVSGGGGYASVGVPVGGADYYVRASRTGCSSAAMGPITLNCGDSVDIPISCGNGWIKGNNSRCCAGLGNNASIIPAKLTGPGGKTVSIPGGQFFIPIWGPGAYQITRPAGDGCKVYTSPVYTFVACSTANVGIGSAIRDDLVCCSDITLQMNSLVPKMMLLTDQLGATPIAFSGTACTFGSPSGAGVDDTFVSSVKGRIGWEDQRPFYLGGGCMPKADDGCKDSFAQWLEQKHTKQSGTTGVRYTVGCDYDGGISVSAQWNYNWGLAYDYRQGASPWCSTCPQWIDGVQYWYEWYPGYPGAPIYTPACSGPELMKYDDHRPSGQIQCVRTNAPEENARRIGYYKSRSACNQIGQEYGPGLIPLPTLGSASGVAPGPFGRGDFGTITVELSPPDGWTWATEVPGDGFSPTNTCPPPPGGTSITLSAL